MAIFKRLLEPLADPHAVLWEEETRPLSEVDGDVHFEPSQGRDDAG
jgi:hypothetical protein